MLQNTDVLCSEIANNYYCEKCDYFTSRNSQYNRHLLTSKHINIDKIIPKTFECSNCCKKYNHRQSLFVHKKKCNAEIEPQNKIIDLKDEIISILLKENNDFKELLMEQNKIMMKSIGFKSIINDN